MSRSTYCLHPKCGLPKVASGRCLAHYSRFAMDMGDRWSGSLRGYAAWFDSTPYQVVERRGWLVMPSGCWHYLGPRSGGYGTLSFRGESYVATRVVIENATGIPVPKKMVAMHHCDNPPCVNPDHLSAGTHTDNMRDMIAKGRSARQVIRLDDRRPAPYPARRAA